MTLSLLAAFAAMLAPMGAGDAATAKFEAKPMPKWSFLAPLEVWTPLHGGIGIAHAGGESFLAHPDGVVLMVDRNGDGKVETKVKGVGGYVQLKAKTKDGQPLRYGVRFKKKGKEWRYASSSSMTGKVQGLSMTLLDLNGNGKWNDYGVDGLVIGGGKAAGFLSRIVSLRGELFDFEVSEDGREVKTSAYQGATGEVSLSLKSKGRLATLAISTGEHDVSFAFHKNGKLRVPVGKYAISGGLLIKGRESARLAAGKMSTIDVQSGQLVELSLGGKVHAEFSFRVDGDKVTVEPKVQYFGQAGEEYLDWLPDNRSPKLFVFKSNKKRPVESGRFASC